MHRELSDEGKQMLRRIVSMLSRLIQRKVVSESTETYLIDPCRLEANPEYASQLPIH